MIHDRIDGVLFDADEDGLSIVLSGEKAEYRLNVQNVLDELYNAVRADVRPYLVERDMARATMPTIHSDEGYDLSDPKHPRYYSTHADIWDMREGK